MLNSLSQNLWTDPENENEKCIGSGTPRPHSQYNGNLFGPQGQKEANKRQRQEIEDKE